MCSQERAISDTIAALGDAGAPRKPEVGKIGGWQPVSGLPTNCPQFVSATSPIKAGLRQAA